MIVPVDSPDHAALTPYTKMRERDLVGREGLFVAEGEVVLRVLVGKTSRMRPRSLLIEKRRVDAVRDVIDALPEDVPVYVVAQDVMDHVVGFSIHRGILAIGERGAESDPYSFVEERSGASADEAPLFVGLVGLTNHDNVGSIFRNAAAFGASGVLIDSETCDPLYRKAIRVSAGTAFVVPFARARSAGELLDVFSASKIEIISLSPRAGETVSDLAREPPRARALLFGTEGPGLPEGILARTRRVRIDIRPDVDSLNVAVASGIALHAVRGR